ncbi:hypothetical protein SAMN04488509_102527 [Aquimonas voraii]|uniref:Uncharacterized protein n=2 Tax=Aquimonas voraii TaxID=265719 RepID=A0A1G6UYD0_9GAMM|nr:hypothetical protein SAMN04488509_102527 [Aquimonas voraii]
MLPVSASGIAKTPMASWQILWVPEAVPGQKWRPVAQACTEACDQEALQITLDRLHPASGGGLIRSFGLHAVFELRDGQSARFTAWRMGGDGALRSESAGSRFVAGRATLRRFELDYQLGDAVHEETLSLTGSESGLLVPGHYLLVGPQADGVLARTSGWVHSGDTMQPLASPVPVDVLSFRIDLTA